MKKQSMSENNHKQDIGQSLVWPQYWNKRINEEIQMRAEKINNLLIIYESDMLQEIQQEQKISKNYI